MKTNGRFSRPIASLVAGHALAVFLLAPALVPDHAQAQTPPSEQKIPTLNGHTFTTTTELLDPFVRTTFRTVLGVGTTSSYPSSSITIGDSTIVTLAGDLLYANLGFQYQQQIAPWLAMQFGTTILGRLGTGIKASLIEGVRASTTGGVGWLMRVLHTDKVYLSGELGVLNNSTTSMDPLGFINGVIEDDGVSDQNRLLTTTPTFLTTFGIRGAYGWTPLLGIIGFAQGFTGDSFDRNKTSETYGEGGLGVDLNLHQQIGAPLSLVIGYTLKNYPDIGDPNKEVVHTNVLQIAYLSPGGFLLSLDLTNQWVSRQQKKGNLHIVWPLLSLKYYF